MSKLAWWMRIVGVFYLVQFVMMVFFRAPIRAIGPEKALLQASLGEPVARFLVDTWITFGLEVGAIGGALLIASRSALQARALVWAVIGVEVMRGIVNDMYMYWRGYDFTVLAIWIVIHTAIIVTGLFALRSARPVEGAVH
jgi:hypothetical protein